jgi:hypothetical protein
MPQKRGIKKGTEKGKPFIESKTTRIKTIEQLLETAKVDLTKYEVGNSVVNKWEVGAVNKETGKIVTEELWQVKVWLKPKNVIIERMEASGEALLKKIEALGKKAPAKAVKIAKPGQRNMLEMGIVDLHMGKYTNARETNSSYDRETAVKLFKGATEHCLEKGARSPIDRILWPVGNDAMHFATPQNMTPAGTPMDTDGRYFEVFEDLVATYIWGIERSLEVAPVHFIFIPGNHDVLPSYHAARELASYFRNNKNVTCDVGPKPRKYVDYGINLLGFTHGDSEKMSMLPTLMAKEEPQRWGRTQQREWHIGHTHLMRIHGESFAGIRIRLLPTLTAHDAWHHKQGYQDRRASEAYLWNYEHGYAEHVSYNVNPS